MAKPVRPQARGVKKEHRGTTQKFIDIQNIQDDVVILNHGNACMVIEVTASNFALLSQEEQNAKIVSYASFLNSLSFATQILIKSERIDISSYLKRIDDEIQKIQNQDLSSYARMYRDFVQELVKVNTVLDKQFYIIVPYSYLERGPGAAAGSTTKSATKNQQFFLDAKNSLTTKANSVHAQLGRIGLRSKTLEKEELIRLFYNIYNENLEQAQQVVNDYQAPIVKTL